MSNSFWNIDEIQQIIDDTTELCISKSQLEEIGDRLKSEGYRLVKLSNLPNLVKPGVLVSDGPPVSFALGIGEKLYPLLESAIAILRESLERDKADERKTQLALEVLGIAFTSGIVDL